MRRYLITLAALLVAGCSEQLPASEVRTVPRDQRASSHAGAIVVRGDYGPDEHGPFTFDGRYAVRFAQRGAGVDFHAEVPFTAHLERPEANGPGKRVDLFQTAARSGGAVITANGRFRVVVDFGDSPYEIRFSPQTSR